MIYQKIQQPVCRITAPAKAILCGEHAVVYGEDAIAIGIGLHCNGEVIKSKRKNYNAGLSMKLQLEQNVFVFESWVFQILEQLSKDKQTNSYDYFQQLFKQQYHTLNQNKSIFFASLHYKLFLFLKHQELNWINWTQQSQYDYNIQINSTIPIGKCLGSSAAFNTVLATSFLVIFSEKNQSQLHHLTHQFKDSINALSVQFQTVEHGTPSGIDNYVSVHGGVILYNRNRLPKFRQLTNSAHRIKKDIIVGVADSCVEKNTKVAVSNVRERCNSDQKYRLMIKQIGLITAQVVSLLEGNTNQHWKERLFQLVQQNHSLLRALGVSHPKIEEIVQKWTSLGWAAKITGSGMGGCVLLLNRVEPTTSSQGLVLTTIDEEGLRITFYQQ